MEKIKSPRQKVRKALKQLLEDRQLMNDMARMTGIMCKLNDRERESLMRYYGIIESNARWDMLTSIFAELIKVMHVEEFRQFEKNIRKAYGFWKVKDVKGKA